MTNNSFDNYQIIQIIMIIQLSIIILLSLMVIITSLIFILKKSVELILYN